MPQIQSWRQRLSLRRPNDRSIAGRYQRPMSDECNKGKKGARRTISFQKAGCSPDSWSTTLILQSRLPNVWPCRQSSTPLTRRYAVTPSSRTRNHGKPFDQASAFSNAPLMSMIINATVGTTKKSTVAALRRRQIEAFMLLLLH